MARGRAVSTLPKQAGQPQGLSHNEAAAKGLCAGTCYPHYPPSTTIMHSAMLNTAFSQRCIRCAARRSLNYSTVQPKAQNTCFKTPASAVLHFAQGKGQHNAVNTMLSRHNVNPMPNTCSPTCELSTLPIRRYPAGNARNQLSKAGAQPDELAQ